MLARSLPRGTGACAPTERAAAPRFLQVSTDEVYGSVETGESREDDRLEPRSPYSSAKAGGELLARSYFVTYGLDVVITRGSNTYGPYHHPEKLIPLFVTNAIDDQPLPLYGDGLQRRDWLYVADHAGAIEHVLNHGVSGEIYNVPGGNEQTNREIVAALLERLGKPWSLVRTVQDRPGHDRRYAMDGSKLAALGWRNRTTFEDGLARPWTGTATTRPGGGRSSPASGTTTTSASMPIGSPLRPARPSTRLPEKAQRIPHRSRLMRLP